MKPSNDLQRKIIKDKDAQSIAEIMKDTGLSDACIRRHAKLMTGKGIWEEGYRKTSDGWLKVFRKIK